MNVFPPPTLINFVRVTIICAHAVARPRFFLSFSFAYLAARSFRAAFFLHGLALASERPERLRVLEKKKNENNTRDARAAVRPLVPSFAARRNRDSNSSSRRALCCGSIRLHEVLIDKEGRSIKLSRAVVESKKRKETFFRNVSPPRERPTVCKFTLIFHNEIYW